MKLENSTKIYDYLLEQGSNGKSILTISNELNISAEEVKDCLSKLSDSFVQVNESENYKVNELKGSNKESLIKEFQDKERNKNNYIFWGLIFFTIFMSLLTVLNSTK